MRATHFLIYTYSTIANNIAQFKNAQSYHRDFYKWKMIDNDQKKFILHLAIATEFFHCAFVNPWMIVPLTELSAY